MKPLLVLDQYFRRRAELFDEATFAALADTVRIEGGEDRPMDPARIAELLPVATFYVAARPRMDAAQVAAAPRLRAVIEVSGAFQDGLDYAALGARGVEILSCSPGFAPAVAEMAAAMILAGARGLVDQHEAFRRGDEAWLDDRPGRDVSLRGARLGFVGYGRIARETHRLLDAFGPKVAAYDPWLAQAPVPLRPLAEIVEQSRILVVTAVPSSENARMIDRALIERLPHGALVVLVSRAHCVDFPALVEAAQADRIVLATDVFPEEPLAPGHPIRSARNVILSPHRAAAVDGGRRPIGAAILHDVHAILDGRADRRLLRADPGRVAELVAAQRSIPDPASHMTSPIRRVGAPS